MASYLFVFDAYGTLFDVHPAVARQRAAIGPNADRISDAWRAKQLEYTWTRTMMGAYRDCRELTAEALDFAAATFGGIDAAAKSLLRRAEADPVEINDRGPTAHEVGEGIDGGRDMVERARYRPEALLAMCLGPGIGFVPIAGIDRDDDRSRIVVRGPLIGCHGVARGLAPSLNFCGGKTECKLRWRLESLIAIEADEGPPPRRQNGFDGRLAESGFAGTLGGIGQDEIR